MFILPNRNEICDLIVDFDPKKSWEIWRDRKIVTPTSNRNEKMLEEIEDFSD